MAVFNFDQVDQYEDSISQRASFNFFKLPENRWQAKVRFMYGPGESFQGYIVHNVSQDPKKPKYVECLRELGDPLDKCPLCQAGLSTNIQYYLPLYVLSITKVINGQLQPEEPVNQIMIFQRGKMFKGALDSAIRQSGGTPLVNNVFNIVRNGNNGDQQTTYSVEFVTRDNTTLESLGERPEAKGSYILPELGYDELLKYVPGNNATPQGVVPRTVNANPYQAPAQPVPNMNAGYAMPNNGYQAPPTAPGIPF